MGATVTSGHLPHLGVFDHPRRYPRLAGRRSVLTPDEVVRLVRACSDRSSSGLRNRALITTLYRAGLRVGEALQLRPNDVDVQARTLCARGAGPLRRVALDAGSFQILESWVRRRSTLELPASAPFFCTLRGKPLASSYLRGLFHRLAVRAGIDRSVSPETLRRSFALELLDEGFSLAAIQAQLGHSSVAVTSRFLARLGAADEPGEVPRRADWRP